MPGPGEGSMRLNTAWKLVLVSIALVVAGGASAASIDKVGPIQTDPGLGCSLYLGGDIGPGDAEALRRLLDDEISRVSNYPDFTVDRQIVLCLESQGGSYIEALDMATLVFDRDVTTRILPSGTCLSACALVFMGGNLNTRSGEGWRSSRYMHPTSRLGFHAPALTLPPGAFDRDDVQAAYAVAIEATGRLLSDAHQLRLPLILIESMFTHRGDDFHYVTTIGEVARYGIKLYGYAAPPTTQASVAHACWNAWNWSTRGNEQPVTAQAYQAMAADFRMQGALFVFSPFDGWALCKHETIMLGGGPKDHVVQSQSEDLSDPMIDTYWPSWIRLPGPSPLTALRDGPVRDF